MSTMEVDKDTNFAENACVTDVVLLSKYVRGACMHGSIEAGAGASQQKDTRMNARAYVRGLWRVG